MTQRPHSRPGLVPLVALLLTATLPTFAGPIHDAAVAGDVAQVRALLDADPALREAPNDVGMTPLILASANGRVAVAAFLLNRGAQVNAHDVNKDTALHLAAYASDSEMARLLLDRGADIDACDVTVRTPLAMAAMLGHTRTVALLLARGADPTIPDRDARTARDWAVPGSEIAARLQSALDVIAIHRAANEGNLATVRALQDHTPALLESRNTLNETPLWSAAIDNRLSVVAFLLERGANPNALCLFDTRSTALMTAGGFDSKPGDGLPLARLLLAHGADPNIRDQNGDTALHSAADHNNAPLVRLLLARGANPALRDAHGETALAVAARRHFPAVVALLRSASPK